MENNYTIKVTKTKEDGTKYFVIQEYKHKDKLSKYEEKMARYRKNLQRKAKARALYESQFEYIEEEVKLPYEIVKSKPRADHGIKTDCVFKWSEAALAMKKLLSDMKTVPVTRTWNFNPNDPNWEPKVHTTYRHPKLSDLTFDIKEQKKPVLTKEEQHKLHVEVKTEKVKKLESREFSDWHKQLVAKAYSTENHRLKQAAEASAHEKKIQKLMKFLREKKLAKYKYRLEFRKLIGSEPTVFITNYSNKPLEYIKAVMDRMAQKLMMKIEDFISINIYDNKTDKLLTLCTGWQADEKYHKIKLDNLKALYPDYYANVA